jgi:hypothetical protein
MFKLLTDETKEKVRHEYVRRRTVVMLSAFIVVLIVGIIGLMPSYLLSNIRQNEVVEQTRILSDTGQTGDESSLQTWLDETNHKLEVLSPTLDSDRPSIFIDQLLEVKNAGIRITGFSWTKLEEKITLTISGVAQDRVTLISFQDNLNASGHFSEVILPLSNLAQDKDLDFQITFSLATSSPVAPPEASPTVETL